MLIDIAVWQGSLLERSQGHVRRIRHPRAPTRQNLFQRFVRIDFLSEKVVVFLVRRGGGVADKGEYARACAVLPNDARQLTCMGTQVMPTRSRVDEGHRSHDKGGHQRQRENDNTKNGAQAVGPLCGPEYKIQRP